MTAAPAPALPDVNREIFPYEMVQHLLDQSADLALYAVPEPGHAAVASLEPEARNDWFGLNGGYGIAVRSRLHRLSSFVRAEAGGVGVSQALGEAIGAFESKWHVSTADLAWTPGQAPRSPLLFDPWSAQRFAMVETEVRLGERGDGFRGYGVGRTFPLVVDGRPRVLAGGVGNAMTGTGRFAGLEGTFVLAGTLTPDLGFSGCVTCRLVDPEGRVCTERELPPVSGEPAALDGTSVLLLRGIKKDRRVKTTYGPPPDARRVSLLTPSEMRAVDCRTDLGPQGQPRAARRVGPVVARMEANVLFDLLAPPGTAQAPVPFNTDELYDFVDAAGRSLGTLTAGVVEGVSFSLRFPAAPGQPGVRFAGFGPITGGTGALDGARGLLTVNSLIGISPHTLSLLHALVLVDPEGRHR